LVRPLENLKAYLVAKSEVLLPVALGNFDGVVDVFDYHAIIRDVPDRTAATSTLKIAGKGGRSARPNLDTRAIGSIRHTDIVHVDVLNKVDLAGILAQATNTDAVAAVANQILHDNVGAVGLERNAIIAIVDV